MNKHQPKALRILIPTEIAEVYGYFSLHAILVFYLIKQLSYTDADAYAFSGQFVALAYLFPVIGGWLADRFLGNRNAILSGGLLLSIGYAVLSLGETLFFAGLSLIIIGNGLFKSNVASFTGEFYKQNDSRREAGFTLIFASVNIGSLVALTSVGYIQKYIGWSACFAAASFASLLGISIFRYGYRYFNGKGLSPHDKSSKLIAVVRNKSSLFWGLSVLLIMVYFSLKESLFASYSLLLFGLVFCLYMIKISWNLESNARILQPHWAENWLEYWLIMPMYPKI